MRCLSRRVPLVLVLLFHGAWSSKTKKCDIHCLNGGSCQRRLETAVDDPHRFDLVSEGGNQQQDQRHYCVCPTGYTGSFCEIKLIVCSNAVAAASDPKQQKQQMMCPNGKACQRAVDDSGVEFFHCACDFAASDLSLPYAAKFCEHTSTTFCHLDGDSTTLDAKKKQDRHSLGGTARSSFCTNGGSCKEIEVKGGRHHPGCNCPAGFTGQHCEIGKHKKTSKNSSLLSAMGGAKPRKRSVLVSFLVFAAFLLGLAVTGVAVLIYFGQRQPRYQHPMRSTKPRSAEDRAKIPKQPPISEIEVI